jgi:hypothetical protein
MTEVIDPGKIVASPRTLKYAAIEDMLKADKIYNKQKNIMVIYLNLGAWGLSLMIYLNLDNAPLCYHCHNNLFRLLITNG